MSASTNVNPTAKTTATRATTVTANPAPVVPSPENTKPVVTERAFMNAALEKFCQERLSSPRFSGVHISMEPTRTPQQVWLESELSRVGAVVNTHNSPDFRAEYIIDRGAEHTLTLLHHSPKSAKYMRGIIDLTGEGLRKFTRLEANSAIPAPVYAVTTALVLNSTSAQRAGAQAAVQYVARIAGRDLKTLNIGIAGYARMGHVVADYARQQGAHTFVIDANPIHALDAHTVGHAVGTSARLLPAVDVLFVSDSVSRDLVLQNISALRDGVIIADVTSSGIDNGLRELSGEPHDMRTGCRAYPIGDATLHVVTDIYTRLQATQTNPAEVRLAIATALLSDMLQETPREKRVFDVPTRVDHAVAQAQLLGLDITIDAL